MVHITDRKQQIITIDNIDSTSYTLNELVPGATYQVQAFTVFENNESAAYISRNFTTSEYYFYVYLETFLNISGNTDFLDCRTAADSPTQNGVIKRNTL